MIKWPLLFGKDFARRRALQGTPAGALHDYLAVPFPSPRLPCQAIDIVAVDLETTGLDPVTDSILSIGLIRIHNQAIQLDSAWHRIVQVDQPIPEQSAILHQITDDAAAQGLPLQQVLPDLLVRLTGKVMLVHHAAVEQGFLDAACRRLYGGPFIAPIIDTQVLAQRQFRRRDQSYKANALRLFNLRDRYHLPRYKAHNALSDALATAELFLAMSSRMTAEGRCRLGDYLVR